MSEPQNVELIQRLYAAFEEDDTAAVLQVCAPDAEWRYPAEKHIRYGGLWRGPDEIARFLSTHDEEEEVLDFRPGDFIAQGDRVVVLGFFRGRAKSSGREWETGFVHAVTARDGKIQRFEAYFDTAAAVEARRK